MQIVNYTMELDVFIAFQAVFSIIKSYVNTLTKDKNIKTWQCKCAEEDISRITFSVLGIKSVAMTELESETRSVDDLEKWLPKSHIFLIMFERVWHELFQISSVSLVFVYEPYSD